jgi:hypothetical protein
MEALSAISNIGIEKTEAGQLFGLDLGSSPKDVHRPVLLQKKSARPEHLY